MTILWLTVGALAVLAGCICLAWYLTNRLYREQHQLAEQYGKGAKFAAILRQEGYANLAISSACFTMCLRVKTGAAHFNL
ncbi:hypothetical protein ABWC92_004590 [Escherichia coli]